MTGEQKYVIYQRQNKNSGVHKVVRVSEVFNI